VQRARWPAAEHEHFFNAGGENRSKCIFTLSTARVNMSSGQILRHYGNHNSTNIFCRPLVSVKRSLISCLSCDEPSHVLLIYGFYESERRGRLFLYIV
jgi:hypothetical protein